MKNWLRMLCAFLLLASCSSENKIEKQERWPLLKNKGKYWPEDTKFLVIVNQYDGDISWASKLNFPHIIYEKNKPDKEPFNAVNKAKAETNLLKFIAEFYDDLPENVIQVYQYEHKNYHQGSLVEILNSPDFITNYEASKTPGFYNFNCIEMGDVAPQINKMKISGWWPETMEPWFGNLNSYGNFTQGKKACGQFVVSRERILSLPREFYINMYEWLVKNTIGQVKTTFDPITKTRYSSPLDAHYNSNWYTSRYMEWSWELIFTKHKNSDRIAIKHSTGEFSAVYGAKNYYRNVSPIVAKNFVEDDKIKIPIEVYFNDLFTDVVVNTPKTLKITIKDKVYELSEEREEDFVADLN